MLSEKKSLCERSLEKSRVGSWWGDQVASPLSMASAAGQLHHLLALWPQSWYKTVWIFSFPVCKI